MKWMFITLAGFALFAFACDTDDESDGTIEPQGTSRVSTPVASPTSATGAGSNDSALEQLKPVIARLLNVEQDVIDDVEFENRVLTITLNRDQSLGGPGDFESACNDLTQAIGFTDLRVVIESTSGSELAECSLQD
jgi:hypothetical protein